MSTAGPIPWVNDSGLDETQRAASEFLRPSQGLQAKLRRRLARLTHRRPATVALDRPILCFTFDDVLSSAATTGAHILESYGARGTYFVSASFTGREGLIGRFATRDELLAAAAAGHELACHTYSHLNCGAASAEQVLADCEHNAHTLGAWGAGPMQSFSYPFGDLSPQSKHAFASKSAAGPLAGFKVLRALHHGLIQTGTDLNQAPSVGVETDYGEANAMKWIERAAARNAWLILYTHDVIEAPSRFGCSPATLERLLQAALSRGFDIVTVAQAAQRIGL